MPVEDGQHLLMVITRAVHIGALMLPSGSFAFLLLVAGPAVRDRETGALSGFPPFCATLSRWNAVSLAIALVSGLAWLGLVAANMSGLPMPEALTGDMLGAVLTGTSFGHVWGPRLALIALLLAGMLFFSRLRTWQQPTQLLQQWCALTGACLLLASIAWIGHSAASGGPRWMTHFVADALHLVAAGLWLGSLPALAFLLRHTLSRSDPLWYALALESTNRYSVLGLISVGTLLTTGVLNSRLLVADLHGLLESPYGRAMLVKLCLFGVMVSIAAVNRQRIRPMLARTDYEDPEGAYRRGVGHLWRNALIETCVGILILFAVGLLTTTPPAVHMMH